MKKFATILFSVFYLLTSVGIVINIHYCEGKVKSVNILPVNTKCCCIVGDKLADCCDDITFLFQLDKEDQISQNVRALPEQPLTVITPDFKPFDHSETVENETDYELLEPPPPQKRPIWLLNCSLTYYG